MSRTRYTDKDKARLLRKFEVCSGSAAAFYRDRGRFCRPVALSPDGEKLALKPKALETLRNGVDIKGGMQRACYELPEK